MMEQKKFKNPDNIYTDCGYAVPHWNIFGSEPEAEQAFPRDQWDMEVTFTKKVKPPKVGDKALSPSGLSEVEIAAIDGDEVWLRYDDGSHSTIDLDKLIYAS